MKNKIRIYCDFSCLQEIYEQCHKPIADFKQEDKPLVWANLYNLLYEHSEIFVNLTYEELQVLIKEKPFFNDLFKKDKLNAVANNFDKIGTEDEFLLNIPPQTLFFLDKTPDECKNLEEDFGLLFISKIELIQKAAQLFSWAICSIEKNSKIYTNWNFLEKFKNPCNSLVLADNYVLDEYNFLEENLLKLLQQILPNKLNKQIFHLTILTTLKNLEPTKQIEKLNKCYNFLQKKLYELYKDKIIKIDITIVLTTSIHDRNLITNYSYFSSGYGFTLFQDNKANKNTTIVFLPLIYLNNDCQEHSKVIDVIKNLQKQYQQVNDKAKNSEATARTMKLLSFQSSNDKQNRLLS